MEQLKWKITPVRLKMRLLAVFGMTVYDIRESLNIVRNTFVMLSGSETSL